MKTSIAQIVALTAYGNASLQGQSVSFDFKHSTAEKCKEITFIEWPRANILANNPNEWFKFLKENKIEYLSLHYVISEEGLKEDRENIGFVGGGGRWLIAAVSGETADIWEGRWIISDESASEENLWTVNYGRIAKEWSLPPEDDLPPLGKTYSNLKSALQDIIPFSEEQNEEEFTKTFKSALNCLTSENPLIDVSHRDLIIEKNYSLKARQILAACLKGFVFGAMGSWNDMAFVDETQKVYDELSDNLFLAIHQSICVAINTFPK
ncbi:MAG: hypothetical protein ACFFDK_09725 [Promethearchaeota archaeon]